MEPQTHYLIMGAIFIAAVVVTVKLARAQLGEWREIRRALREFDERQAQRKLRRKENPGGPFLFVRCHVCKGAAFTDDNRLCPACEGNGCILKQKRDKGIKRLIDDIKNDLDDRIV